jgi:GalNAc-alpha-(1->4)-GalNAc-alpha-(1->3)-diNAcBac-PP-undecaprenol alpha-1,4-N-acetyl-D-galactosaminyltransferase
MNGGGAQRVLSVLANTFCMTHNVKVISFSNESAFELNNKIELANLHNGKIKNHTIRSFVNLYNHYKVKRNRPDVIVTFMPENALISIPVSKFFGIKHIVSEHTNHKANSKFYKKKWTRKLLYPCADIITILTSYDYNFYSKKNKNVVIIPNPISPLKKNRQFENRKKNILAAGSLNRYRNKGFDSLLHIAAPLLHQNKEWCLTIAGAGKEGMNELKKICIELGIDEQVYFPGFCDNIYELMQQSQIFTLTSKFEGLPMVLMEALSNGLACIAYDCVSGPRDLINNEENGLLIEDQNTSAFQEGLEKLMINEKLRKKIAAAGPTSMKPYDLPEIVKKWHALFNQL